MWLRRGLLDGHAAGMSKIPPRTAVDAYFARMRAVGVQRQLDVAFDVDLGELVDGHHVVVRGIERGPGEAVLHYEFVPAVQEHERQDKGPLFWYWMVYASDDIGTEYDDHNTGGFDPSGRGPSSHGTRDLGGAIPAVARRLVLDFEPPWRYTPAATVCRRLTIELATGAVTAVSRT
jgi:hypothetical protein